MHYIRLLRPPQLSVDRKGKILDVRLAITTDLGDAFLSPLRPIPIAVFWINDDEPEGDSRYVRLNIERSRFSDERVGEWTAGMRALKLSLPFNVSTGAHPPRILIVAGIRPQPPLDADDLVAGDRPRILPITSLVALPGSELDHVASREFASKGSNGHATMIWQLNEEMGESIDRHIWDTGLVMIGVMQALCASISDSRLQAALPLSTRIMTESRRLKSIELGCGIGIFSLALAVARCLHRPASETSEDAYLLTDLQPAEAICRSNIASLSSTLQALRPQEEAAPRITFSHLDWERARTGNLDEDVALTPWDIILLSDVTYNVDMFPALVSTLSVIHDRSLQVGSVDTLDVCHGPKVFLATKQRHDSEQELFRQLREDNWGILEKAQVPLPMIAAADVIIEVYLLGKNDVQTNMKTVHS